jgi:hypothetical protein
MSVHKPSIKLHTLIFPLHLCDFSKCVNFYISFETYVFWLHYPADMHYAHFWLERNDSLSGLNLPRRIPGHSILLVI